MTIRRKVILQVAPAARCRSATRRWNSRTVASQFREAISRSAADATLGHPTKSFSSLHEEGLKRSGGLMGRHYRRVQRHRDRVPHA
jgi:hypothetical protein